MAQLLPYQIQHTELLANAILKHSRALDTSDTGTGKTYCAVALCKKLNLQPFIICPKSVMTNWRDVCYQFNINVYGIVNYETFINGHYYQINNFKKKNQSLFLQIHSQYNYNFAKTIKEYNIYPQCISDNVIFIFDEAHRVKNKESVNGHIYKKLSSYNHIKILLISATIIDKDIYTDLLIHTFQLNKYEYSVKRNYLTRQEIMEKLHKTLFPEYGHRMRISQLRTTGFIKNNNILVKPIQMDNVNEIKRQYEIIKIALHNLKRKREKANGLGLIIRALQSIELLKLPSFILLTEYYLSKNCSVALFFNYSSTLLQFTDYFNTQCVIQGSQSIIERQKHINSFNTDKSRLIVCNIKAGGVGLSLHDTIGNYPRVSLISPTWSAQDLLQVLGRIYRANCKTDCEQRILFCCDTFEEIVSNAIQSKIENIGLLNDGDIRSYLFTDEFNNIEFNEDMLNKVENELIETDIQE